MMATMNRVNQSSETLLNNATEIEKELETLDHQVRLLETRADEDAQLIHEVSLWKFYRRLRPLKSRAPSR